jgi:integrase/recombinase XerD
VATKYKAANGYWYVKYKGSGGEWKTKYCGKNATASDAEVIRKIYDAQELNQRHSAAIRIVDADLLQSLEHYRDTEIPKSRTGRPRSKKSIQRYQAVVDNFTSFFKEKNCARFSSVTEKLLLQFFDYLVSGLHRSASTIEKHRQIAINFFDWAIAENYLVSNPALKVPNPKRAKSVPRFFSEEELQKIFEAAKGPYRNIFKFLYLTGLRTGELCNLEWADYVESQRHIILRVVEGNKTKREEIVPLNDAAVRILEEQKEVKCSPWIFTNSIGVQLDGANIYRSLGTIMKNCNIENASPHTFRHTCASHLAIKGVSLYIIKEILRHASIKETEIYAHLSKEAVATAIQLLDA